MLIDDIHASALIEDDILTKWRDAFCSIRFKKSGTTVVCARLPGGGLLPLSPPPDKWPDDVKSTLPRLYETLKNKTGKQNGGNSDE